MNVLGKDKQEEAYRVAIKLGGGEVIALIPDALLSQEYGQDMKVSHGQAYEWIAAQQHDLTEAIATLVKGGQPRAPFTLITLEGR